MEDTGLASSSSSPTPPAVAVVEDAIRVGEGGHIAPVNNDAAVRAPHHPPQQQQRQQQHQGGGYFARHVSFMHIYWSPTSKLCCWVRPLRVHIYSRYIFILSPIFLSVL